MSTDCLKEADYNKNLTFVDQDFLIATGHILAFS
jgi:hypothetical protein